MEVHVGGTRELEQLADKLKAQRGSAIERRVAREIQRAARPIRPALSAAVAGVRVQQIEPAPSGKPRRRGDSGLRRRTAGAIAIRGTRRGARISVDGARIHRDADTGNKLAKYLDTELGGYKRWRHPVFNTGKWAQQQGQPWFFVTIRRFESRIGAAVRKAVDSIAADITK